MSVALFFEDSRNEGSGFLFENPVAQICARQLDEVRGCLEAAETWRKKGFYVAGFVAYEAGYALIGKAIPHQLKKTSVPLLCFYVFKEKKAHVLEGSKNSEAAVFDFQVDTDFREYESKLKDLKSHFSAGNSYQTNFTLRQTLKTNVDSKTLYTELRKFQKVPYGALLQTPEFSVLSFSPELFVEKRGEQLVTRPMKGTSPRGSTPAEDEAHRQFLKTDEKTLAENLMIVDLLRNDMGKLAKAGSVNVEDLFDVQSFETLHQMVTTVTAKVEESTTVGEVFESLFPCGSITGAPKIRTMELIAQMEKSPRGIYTGSIGFISPNNDFCFNVAIRTLVEIAPNSYELGLGGGILVDSDIQSEFDECLLKGRFVKKLNQDFSVFETFAFGGNGSDVSQAIEKLSEHWQRLEKSCRFFDFPWEKENLFVLLREQLPLYASSPHKMKISVNFEGKLELQASPIEPFEGVKKVGVSSKKTRSDDIFLRHKTSRREIYENEFLKARANHKYEVLFFNEKNELTEASRHNIFLKIGEQWWTPPISCGLLPGVGRALAMKELNAKERVLHHYDLHSAEQILLTNAVRGMVEVHLAGDL